MLSKQNRADKNSIKEIFQKGRFVSSANLTFKYIPKGSPDNTRVSFIAPKTTSKSAAKRNLLRRRGYAVLGKHMGSLPSKTLGAFILGKNSLSLFGKIGRSSDNGSLTNLENEIKSILSKIN